VGGGGENSLKRGRGKERGKRRGEFRTHLPLLSINALGGRERFEEKKKGGGTSSVSNLSLSSCRCGLEDGGPEKRGGVSSDGGKKKGGRKEIIPS